MSSNNPGNFANRPKEEVREIAAKGGHASHKNDGNDNVSPPSYHPLLLQSCILMHKSQSYAGGDSGDSGDSGVSNEGRNPDGTFAKGSQAAKEAGAKSHGGTGAQ